MASANTLKTDWLASEPVFYNEMTGEISYNINDVIDWNNIDFHPEGLINYLDFGYSVFEQTPLKGIKFLRHSSQVSNENGRINLAYFDDMALKQIGKETSEDDVMQMLERKINEWADKSTGDIVLPVSGGYDSRLLALLMKDKSRISAFTYGISEKQEESFEVVKARKIAEILSLKWQFIPLGRFHNYFEDWDKAYGISTHAHGMYHYEFYDKMMPMIEGDNPFLSGIIGDAWAGSLHFGEINTPEDLLKLAITHGMHAQSDYCRLKSDKALLSDYFEKHHLALKDSRFQIVQSMRMKITMLSYLIRTPRYFGLKPWSPFLHLDVSLAMLNLPDNRRKDRLWQTDFFKKHKLNIENLNLECAWENTLNFQAIDNVRPKPLKKEILRELFDVNYIENINKILAPKTHSQKTILKMLTIWGTRGLLYRMGYRNNSFDKPAKELLKAYCAYLTIKPVENVLLKRNIFAKQKK